MTQIKFFGIGGQGVVTAAKMLSIAVSLYEEEYAITVPSYGHERRGAAVYTDIIVDKEPIKMNCCVYEPDAVIILDDTIENKNVNVGVGAKENTIMVINTASEETAKAYATKYGFKESYWVDATQISVETIGRNIPNGAILGAISKAGIVPIESVEKGIIDFWGEKVGSKNAAAARKAYEATKAL